MASIEEILKRIDDVLTQNRRIEWIYIALTVLLFGTERDKKHSAKKHRFSHSTYVDNAVTEGESG